jgi:hypothetical protein
VYNFNPNRRSVKPDERKTGASGKLALGENRFLNWG